MSSYYERYLRGEHTEIWDELSQLGNAVYTEPLHADALAVARETMRRAQDVIILLQHRLQALNYRFGVTHFEPVTCFWLEDEVEPPPPYQAAGIETLETLAALEAPRGRWPLSLRAWFERIACVNFVGTFASISVGPRAGGPGEADDSLAGAPIPTMQPDALPAEVVQVVRAQPEAVDPFWCWPLPSLHDVSGHLPPPPPWHLILCPDVFVKGGEPGGDPYVFTALEPTADVWLESERWRMRFVPYLRHCLLEWGGFPGVGEFEDLPSSVMTPLTNGLTPF